MLHNLYHQQYLMAVASRLYNCIVTLHCIINNFQWPNKKKHSPQWQMTDTHTHQFNGPFDGTTQVSQYQKGKPIWILLKQETVASAGPYASLHLAPDS